MRDAVLLSGLLLATAGCESKQRKAPARFEIQRVSPDLGVEAEGLLLNEAITVYFSAPVDPFRVTEDTFAVLDAEGHPVEGSLRCEGRWVTFHPRAPLTPSLTDGGLQPASDYRLVVVGYPRPDGLRAASGARLLQGLTRRFSTAAFRPDQDRAPVPLRAVQSSLPFAVKEPLGNPMPLPADDSRLLLHFTLPVSPVSLAPSAVEVSLLRAGQLIALEPHRLRLLPAVPMIDEHAGQTLEVDLGSSPRRVGGGFLNRLEPGDSIVVQMRSGEGGLLDHAGRSLPPGMPARWWLVVRALTVAEWPSDDDRFIFMDDFEVPGFEVFGADEVALRPLVRVEAGDGSLGVFRPLRDTVLRPGEAVDRGDGVLVQSQDRRFPFRAIDIPDGVTVTIDARVAPVQLLAQGRVRIAGSVVVEGESGQPLVGSAVRLHPSTLVASGVLSVLAAGGIEIRGDVSVDNPRATLSLMTAGRLQIDGRIPMRSILATEQPDALAGAGLVGREVRAVRIRLTPGLPRGCEMTAQAQTSYRQLSYHRTGGLLQTDQWDAGIDLFWQSAPADPVQPDRPDRAASRSSAPRRVVLGERVDAAPGEFVRLRLDGRVRGGQPLPAVRRIQVLDR